MTISDSPSFFFKAREAIDAETEEKQGVGGKKLHLKHLYINHLKKKNQGNLEFFNT